MVTRQVLFPEADDVMEQDVILNSFWIDKERAEYSFGRGGSENHDDRVTHKIQDIALPGIDDFNHFFQIVVGHSL